MAPGRDRDRDALSLFADELKAARQQRGWTQGDLAGKLHYSGPLVAMVENLHRAPSPDLAQRLDEVFGTSGTFARLEARLRDLPFPSAFRPFAAYEAVAVSLRTFQHSLVPGLLQTPAYARAVLSTRPNTSDEDVEKLVAARLARQAVLERENPPILWVLLDEGVLHRPVASASVMYDQLMHLAEISRLPNIAIQVVPYDAGGHSGLLGAFVIADLDSSVSIVYLEDASDGRVTEDASAVTQVTLRFDTLRSEALPKGASRDMIASVAEERWKGSAPSPGAHQATAETTAATVSRLASLGT
ncbi:MAG: helix-turn-helix transcriptional regulator [Streptosporangiaceae bacterium]|nr:helix-turn-helix transcriptional regulator [Streptosporangiaceae bacterium]MBV9854227.1 helix-turn-helix transcriptional regulator [Streptosporangiaceae bacterium]